MHKHRLTLYPVAVLAVSCLAACRLQAEEPEAASAWIEDAETGVRIWNPSPSEGETVQWLGAKEAATGLGIAIWKVAGKESERASGDWSDGRLDGHAIWKHRSGARYEGCWKNGRRQGPGVYSWPDGTRFCGRYQDGTRQEGTFFDGDGNPVNGAPPDDARKLALDAETAALQARKTAAKARKQTLPPRKAPAITQNTQPATAQSQP